MMMKEGSEFVPSRKAYMTEDSANKRKMSVLAAVMEMDIAVM
jgi:hypothetical protein